MANVKTGAVIAAGLIGTDFLAAKLDAALPAAWKTDANLTRIGTKAAIGIGLPLLAGKFLPRGVAKTIAIGGTAAVVLDLFQTYVAGKLGMSLTGYETGMLTDYQPGTITGIEEGQLSDTAYGGGAY